VSQPLQHCRDDGQAASHALGACTALCLWRSWLLRAVLRRGQGAPPNAIAQGLQQSMLNTRRLSTVPESLAMRQSIIDATLRALRTATTFRATMPAAAARYATGTVNQYAICATQGQARRMARCHFHKRLSMLLTFTKC
jgi:hypothetical protein